MTLRRTLQRSLSTTTRGLLQFGSGGVAYDTDAQAYITAVEAADGQSLETGVKDAINAFVVGCKDDGIWTAIKASCILAGARTLTGALVPLVGTAPTNNNFVSGDYSRTAGLKGNKTTKYLDSNRANNADPQNNQHLSCYFTETGAAGDCFIGSQAIGTGYSNLFHRSTGAYFFTIQASALNSIGTVTAPDFYGASRNNSANFDYIAGTNSGNIAQASVTPASGNIAVFRDGPTGPYYHDCRIAFYSIGEALDLALLDSRVTALIANMAFVINTGLSPVGYSTETINYVNAGYAAGGTLA